MSAIESPVAKATARAIVKTETNGKRPIARVICSRCGSQMFPQSGFTFDERVTYLWWRCQENDHVTDALPVPSGLQTMTRVMTE